MPVSNAHVVSMCVLLKGPPWVRMKTTVMSVAVKTIPKRRATSAIGSCSGSVTYQNFLRPVAPSTFAASSTSDGIEARPAMKMTVANGMMRQAEVRVVPGLGEVAETDPLPREGACGRVGEAEVDREDQRAADEKRDEDDRRRDEKRRQKAALLEEVAPAAT